MTADHQLTVKDVYDSMTHLQQNVLNQLIGEQLVDKRTWIFRINNLPISHKRIWNTFSLDQIMATRFIFQEANKTIPGRMAA